ncbi:MULTISPECIES: glycosyltransferase [Symbiopectobacterium]|uniref:glycosyltransferase n=1 Tax=Symbiopectobacterium TaxID=801 RepID=UPI001A2F888D|nr:MULTISPECIES: glycosyltransferase [Symbiopectobacterium]MBG6247617.1 hypothetical protein [Candidatus Symbiopectobacterium sp. PLON1]MBT9429738.1 glycosyltransferase [Candidatus Symbiopectobacterium endolongispinus]
MDVGNKMKNILIVAPSSIYGGGEVYIKNLVGYLRMKSGFYISVGVCNKRLYDELSASVDHVFKVNASLSQVNKLKNIFLINNNYCKKHVTDILFLNGLPESGLFAACLSHHKVVCIGHSNESYLSALNKRKGISGFFVRYLFYAAFRKIKLFIAINEVARRNLLKFIPSYNRCEVVYNGVPPLVIDNQLALTTVSKAKRPFVIGRISRLTPGKNVELAIDSIRGLNGQIKLIIAGEGPHREYLEQYAQGVDVQFLGHCSPQVFCADRCNVTDYTNRQ